MCGVEPYSRPRPQLFPIRTSKSVNNIIYVSIYFCTGSCSLHIDLSYFNGYLYYYSFQSPNYPSCYPNNKDCIWLIESPPGDFVDLRIYAFDLEYGSSSCPWDYLEIRDGNSPSSPLIAKACGSLAYLNIYSTGRFLFVHFHSNSIIGRPGFAAWAFNVKKSKISF